MTNHQLGLFDVDASPSGGAFDAARYTVAVVSKGEANRIVVERHYLHRRPSNRHSFALIRDNLIIDGVVIFGTPASRNVQVSAWPNNPDGVLELVRMWVDDRAPRNAASFMLARALSMLPPHLVISYADTSHGHTGIVYRAANFRYAGWTDMDRKTPRLDYVMNDRSHTRNAFRSGAAAYSHVERRRPKAKYWIAVGTRRDRKLIESECGWPVLDWSEYPVPDTHLYRPTT